MSLEKAAPEVQLAVDLIYLLESNDLGPEVVLAALEIVQTDYKAKLLLKKQQTISPLSNV
ncbi:pleiotropic regulatory protein RsmS [Obesumbacterium proteus]|uniref:pleiotropic regulatory protein RsmS n=1 Tax=Obesumbacterium proteus TaxID=82983 RepID=UPI001F2574D0|nr:pleiotropic regulatory protein RsmS [Obesumbacterium proteus]MCE9884084.1 pleiotropic regulatory protein RsmS [Obesumbacterium proteus]MCE9914282.1 pleiotropic regulatory protein RsmS [Obesumbacterium proteus]MCE9929576.1 pleiotropic regulatory protein RsmS [Obesumbacterium proteus]MCG2876840.1 pleiotropic regulatory protein RsmS [Obesumbacterium proteus]